MKKEETQRNFAMSFAELEQFVRNVISSMRRDDAEFANYGVDSNAIDDFENLCNLFEEIPTDEELEGIVTITTQEKDAKADELRVSTREITTRVEVKFGENSGQYRSCGVENLTKLSDSSLLRCGRRVHRRGADMLADLASEGLTQQILDDYNALNQEFEEALDNKDDAVKDRDISTDNRVQKANDLYTFLSNYCNYGKRIWVNTNEAKYNDYVIYSAGTGAGTPRIKPDAPELSYSPSGFSWDAVETATSYQLVYHAVGDMEWIELYAGAMPEAPIPFNPDNGEYVARLRARNAVGYSDWSDELTVTIGLQPPEIWELVYNSGTSQVTLQWHNSIGTSENDIYQSIVPIGDPAGVFTLIDTISAQLYQHEVTN